MGGPGTGGDKGEAGDSECSCCSALPQFRSGRAAWRMALSPTKCHRVLLLAWHGVLARRCYQGGFYPQMDIIWQELEGTRASVSWSSVCVHMCAHVCALRPGHLILGLTSCPCAVERLWGNGACPP